MPLVNVVRYTMIFGGQSSGWTESWYRPVTPLIPGTVPDLIAELGFFDTIVNLRAQMLAPAYVVKAQRVSFAYDANGLSSKKPHVLSYAARSGPSNLNSDIPNKAVLTIWRTGQGALSKFTFIRGIPLNLTDGNGNFSFNAPWLGRLQAYSNAVRGGQLGWISRTPVHPPTAVTNYTLSATGNTYIITCGAGTFPAPMVGTRQVVTIQGVNVKSELNGSVLVDVVSTTSCVTVKPYGLQPFQSPGRITVYDRNVAPTGGATPQKLVTRRAGAPLLLSRGRRSARVRD